MKEAKKEKKTKDEILVEVAKLNELKAEKEEVATKLRAANGLPRTEKGDVDYSQVCMYSSIGVNKIFQPQFTDIY